MTCLKDISNEKYGAQRKWGKYTAEKNVLIHFIMILYVLRT